MSGAGESELLQVGDNSCWEEIDASDSQPRGDFRYPENAGPAFDEIPQASGLKLHWPEARCTAP